MRIDRMKYGKRCVQIVLVVLVAGIGMQIACKKKDKPNVTAATFNRRFLPTIKPAMTYEQIEKIVGEPGTRISEDKNASPQTIQYRWNGSKESVLTVTFGNNKMIEATVLAPNGHTYLIQNNGEVADVTK
jgi:hypothetical protein